jgi:hypothetical protein
MARDAVNTASQGTTSNSQYRARYRATQNRGLPVRLDPVAWLAWNQDRRSQTARVAWLDELPVEPMADRIGFIANYSRR